MTYEIFSFKPLSNLAKNCSKKGFTEYVIFARCNGDKRLSVQIIIARVFLFVGLFWMLIFAPAAAYSQPSKGASSAEWDKLVGAAKKEGKVTVSLPASGEIEKTN